MTPNKIRNVIEIYRARLIDLDAKEINYSHEQIAHLSSNIFGHCLGMLDRMLEFIEEGRIEKTFRWLGFVQGCLWAEGIYTLEDLRGHNRPD